MTDVDPVPPAPVVPTPPTAYCTLEQVADRLRIADPAGDPDGEWLELCWLYACQQIDLYFVDRPLVAPYPAGVTAAAVGITAMAFRAKDVMSDTAEEFDGVVPVRVPRVPLAAYEGWLYGFRYGGSWAPA